MRLILRDEQGIERNKLSKVPMITHHQQSTIANGTNMYAFQPMNQTRSKTLQTVLFFFIAEFSLYLDVVLLP